MARGKKTCGILKDIRRRIAEANNIEFATSDCRYQGDCPGSCPKCEAEVRYLEEQLTLRRLAGKTVFLAGLTVLSACTGTQTAAPAPEAAVEVSPPDTVIFETDDLEGDVDFPLTDSIEKSPTHNITDLLVVGEVELPDEAVSDPASATE